MNSDILMHPLVMPITATFALGLLAYVLSRWLPLACKALALAAGAVVIAGGVSIVRVPEADSFFWSWLTLSKGKPVYTPLPKPAVGAIRAIGRFKDGDTIRTDRYRYTLYRDKQGQTVGQMLYDHQNDPMEWTNLAGNPKSAAVKKKLAAWLPKVNVEEGPRGSKRKQKSRPAKKPR